MQNTDRAEDDRNSSSDNAGNGTEAAGEQPTDFSTEIMSVTEMEQSPDGSPDATEETTQDSKIPNVADLTTTDIEANFPPEYEKFWKAVVENPQDFTGWVYLLQYVEQEVSTSSFPPYLTEDELGIELDFWSLLAPIPCDPVIPVIKWYCSWAWLWSVMICHFITRLRT